MFLTYSSVSPQHLLSLSALRHQLQALLLVYRLLLPYTCAVVKSYIIFQVLAFQSSILTECGFLRNLLSVQLGCYLMLVYS